MTKSAAVRSEKQKKVDGTLTIYGRQFKEAVVDTLIVPKGNP